MYATVDQNVRVNISMRKIDKADCSMLAEPSILPSPDWLCAQHDEIPLFRCYLNRSWAVRVCCRTRPLQNITERRLVYIHAGKPPSTPVYENGNGLTWKRMCREFPALGNKGFCIIRRSTADWVDKPVQIRNIFLPDCAREGWRRRTLCRLSWGMSDGMKMIISAYFVSGLGIENVIGMKTVSILTASSERLNFAML